MKVKVIVSVCFVPTERQTSAVSDASLVWISLNDSIPTERQPSL